MSEFPRYEIRLPKDGSYIIPDVRDLLWSEAKVLNIGGRPMGSMLTEDEDFFYFCILDLPWREIDLPAMQGYERELKKKISEGESVWYPTTEDFAGLDKRGL